MYPGFRCARTLGWN